MDKRFDPAAYEQKWQQRWAEAGYFVAESRSERPPYCIMIPPPNVTGRLHMGHALQSAIQDLLVRWRRMQGFNALWLPGTDHAGIATQLMVERDHRVGGIVARRDSAATAFLERTCGRGRRSTRATFVGSSTCWVPAATGVASGSPSMSSLSMAVRRGLRAAPRAGSDLGATSTWSTGRRVSTPPSPTSRSR